MREYLNENSLANTIAMFRQVSNQLILIVEGSYDKRALKRHVTEDIKIYPAEGKQKATRAAELVARRNVPGTLFLIDRDYDDYSGQRVTYPENVVPSDGHDSFTDLILADIDNLIDVIEVYLDESEYKKSNAKNESTATEILDKALDLARAVSAVRIVNSRYNMGLNLKQFKFGTLGKRTHLDALEVLERLLPDHCPDTEQLVIEVSDEHAALRSASIPLIGDHDLFEAIAHVLSSYGKGAKQINLHRTFLFAITCKNLKRPSWFRTIQNWASRYHMQGFGCTTGACVV